MVGACDGGQSSASAPNATADCAVSTLYDEALRATSISCTDSSHLSDNTRHATCSMQHATCTYCATCNVQESHALAHWVGLHRPPHRVHCNMRIPGTRCHATQRSPIGVLVHACGTIAHGGLYCSVSASAGGGAGLLAPLRAP